MEKELAALKAASAVKEDVGKLRNEVKKVYVRQLFSPACLRCGLVEVRPESQAKMDGKLDSGGKTRGGQREAERPRGQAVLWDNG